MKIIYFLQMLFRLNRLKANESCIKLKIWCYECLGLDFLWGHSYELVVECHNSLFLIEWAQHITSYEVSITLWASVLCHPFLSFLHIRPSFLTKLMKYLLERMRCHTLVVIFDDPLIQYYMISERREREKLMNLTTVQMSSFLPTL